MCASDVLACEGVDDFKTVTERENDVESIVCGCVWAEESRHIVNVFTWGC